jgi:hypothetical protein
MYQSPLHVQHRGPRRRIAAWLFLAALLCGQAMLLAHELEHGLALEHEGCILCLHASHDSNALPNIGLNIALVPPGEVQAVVPQTESPCLPFRAQLARAPPATIIL